MKNIINEKKGITLISLIITIIIMLILAGVSIKVAVDDNFIGKAENANTMNENAIDRAEINEEEALKGNVDDFNAYEEIESDFIEVYALEDNPKAEGTKILTQINEALSKYIEEKGASTLYFKVINSNWKNLFYTTNKLGIGELKNEYADETTGAVVINGNNDEAPEGANYKKKNSILEVDIESVDELNKLTIVAKKNSSTSEVLAQLTFEYNSLTIDSIKEKTIYLPKGQDNIKLSWNESGDGYYITGTNSKVYKGNDDMFEESNWTSLSDMKILNRPENSNLKFSKKTLSNINSTMLKVKNNNIENNIEIDLKNISSTIVNNTNNDTNKLYIVQEEINDAENHYKTIYMDDIRCEVYEPIIEIDFRGPTTIPFVFSDEEELKFDYKNADIYNNKCVNNSSDNDIKNGFLISKSENKFWIKSNLNGNISGNNKIEATISAVDYGGKIVNKNVEIRVATDSFIVSSKNDNGEYHDYGYYTYLSSALEDAKERIKNGHKNVIVQQNTSEYNPFGISEDIDSDFFTKGTETQTIGITKDDELINKEVKVAYFHIDKDLTGLTYDLNGNNLRCTIPGEGYMVRMKIYENTNFTLKSSNGKDDKEWKNGEITFNVEKTFDDKLLNMFDSWNINEFKKSFTKYTSFEEFMKSKGVNDIKIYHYLWYPAVYANEFLSDFKDFMNTYNTIGFQNKDYKRNVDAVENYGTFNFHSGRIVLTSEEQVRAIGAWDGSIVMDIIEAFLGVLRKLNINVLKITDWTSGYAKLEHTGAVISNHKVANLGYGEGGITPSTKAFPEIVINLKSIEEAWGVTMGSIFNPNRSITRVYGIWNKNQNATTTMNSGFISMIIRNETNNWVSLGVGKAYGIFNDKGTTYLNGFTKKRINTEANYYGLGTLVDEVRVDFKSNILQGLEKLINGLLDDLKSLKDTITGKWYNGFYTFSTQKILYNFTGGATIVYTNSYAVANAHNRNVNKPTDVIDNDGIHFGTKLGLEEVNFETDWNLFNNNNQKDTMKSLIPVKFYYRLYDIENDKERKNGIDYNFMTHQKIINPLNVLFEGKLGVVDELATSALGSMVNGLNNIAFASWIGEDFEEKQDVFSSLISVGFREIKQSLRSFITFDD